MSAAKGRVFIDSIDIWENFGMFIMDGMNDFLKVPKRKEPITHDWQDANGIDVDLSRVFFEARDITLKVGFKTGNVNDFWQKYTQFLSQITKPYLHRLEITEFGRSYYVYYKDCGSYKRYKKITGDSICEFTITLNEPNPTIDNPTVFIVADEGQFIIT